MKSKKAIKIFLLILFFTILQFGQVKTEVYAASTSTNLAKDKSIQLTNITEESNYVYINCSTDGKYDYVVYSSIGSTYSSYYDCTGSSIYVPAGYKVIITARVNSATITCDDSYFSFKNTDTPAYKRINLGKDKSIYLTNSSKESKYVHIDYSIDGRCDYVVYNSIGTTYSSDYDYTGSSIYVPAGYKVVITAKVNSALIICNNSCFSLKNTNSPAYKRINLAKDTSMELTNSSKESKYVHINYSTDGRCDYVVYNSIGTTYSSDYDYTGSYIYVPAGYKVIITAKVNSALIICNNSCFSLKNTNSPAYKRINLAKDTSIELTNSSKESKYVHINYSTDGRCDYIVYNSIGTTYSSNYNYTGSSIYVPAGYKVIITAKINSALIICNNSCFSLKVEKVTLNKKTITLKVGNKETLISTIYPNGATNKNVTWKSSNPSVVKVDNKGKITAVSKGSAIITVTTADGSKKATCSVTVSNPVVHPTSVILNKTTDNLKVGGTDTLIATIKPLNATNKNIIWKSSNPSVVKVDNKGKISAVSKGSAIITVTTADGSKKATCSVTVSNPVVHPTSVILNKTTDNLKVGGTDTLIATIKPLNATNKNIIWKSSNPSVIKVDNKGKITAVSKGSAIIIVTTADASNVAICNVTVTK